MYRFDSQRKIWALLTGSLWDYSIAIRILSWFNFRGRISGEVLDVGRQSCALVSTEAAMSVLLQISTGLGMQSFV